MDNEETIITASGASSSKAPAFHLLPLDALLRACKRFEVGSIKHGPMNWRKGIGQNYMPPLPCIFRDYAIERLNHIIYHAFKLIAKLQGLRVNDGDDDSGAIIWGGLFIAEYIEEESKRKDNLNDLLKQIDESGTK